MTTSMARSSFLSTYTGVQRTYVISLWVFKILKLEVILSVSELLIVQESTEKAVHKNDYVHIVNFDELRLCVPKDLSR